MKPTTFRRSWRGPPQPLPSLALAACSAGSLGSSSGEGTTILFLVDNSDPPAAAGKALADGFRAKNPDITVDVTTRPQSQDRPPKAGYGGTDPVESTVSDRPSTCRL